jgi:hypothetical protein
MVFFSPLSLTRITFMSLENSLRTCLHAPHGETGGLTAVEITIVLNDLSPDDTAAATALRSAQIVKPYDLFSTFEPV